MPVPSLDHDLRLGRDRCVAQFNNVFDPEGAVLDEADTRATDRSECGVAICPCETRFSLQILGFEHRHRSARL